MMTVNVQWRGDEVMADLLGAAPDALNYAAELLRGWSVEAAPIRDGLLRESAQVTPAGGNTLTAYVSFDTLYAWRQHEELTWNHPGGGGAKYLEGPLLEHEGELMQAVASRIGEAIT